MTALSQLQADIEGLLDQVAINEMSGRASTAQQFLVDIAFERAHMLIRLDEDARNRTIFETRLRLALHFSPRSAIHYDSRNPRPRWELIRDHLSTAFGRDRGACEPLARGIAMVLQNWQRERQQTTLHKNFLLRRDGPNCQNCHVVFEDLGAVTVVKGDLYKPYVESPLELLSAEVDHIEAISALGNNMTQNLQLLCRLCNAGKSDGLGLDVRLEADYAGSAISDIPSAHRMRLAYYVIDRDQRRCKQCDRDDVELTIRPYIPDGAFVRSNLRAICVICAFSL